MIPELGTALVLLALFFASAGAALGFASGYRHHLAGWAWARRAAFGFSWTMIAANLLMVYALVTKDFSVHYVAEVGSKATPLAFSIVSLWASLNGSILFWGGVLAVYTLAFVTAHGHRHREYMPWTLGVLMANAIFFTLLVGGIANPFERVSPVPLDGPGPNPLLQNHWLMIVHPPTLYLGYVGMVVPFAMICAALFAGRLDAGWMLPLRRWMLIPWIFLTVGIVLGGWWSYGVLGWGGAWAWDPVENASFHPWLTGTAFLHSAMIFQRRGTLRVWTLVLGMATFLLTLLGTFMTRSGVFNSVHSFTQSDIGPVFLVYIGITLVFSVVLLALREHTLAFEDGDHQASTSMMGALFGRDLHLLGRETSLLLQNAVFTVFTFTVLLGTLWPLIAEAFLDQKVSVGEPYFDRWALPLGLAVVFLMGVGPALPWGRMSPRRALEKLGPAVGSGVVFAALFALGGFTQPMVLFALFLCGFAFHANAAEFLIPWWRRVRARGESPPQAASNTYLRMRRRLGGHVAHFGVLLAVISIALGKGYKQEVDLTLKPGETAMADGVSITFLHTTFKEKAHRSEVRARFDVHRGDRKLATLAPGMNYYPSQREPIFTPDIHETLAGDVYLSVVELGRDGAYVVVRVIQMPAVVWLWIAPVFMVIGTLIVLWPDRASQRARVPAGAGVAAK